MFWLFSETFQAMPIKFTVKIVWLKVYNYNLGQPRDLELHSRSQVKVWNVDYVRQALTLVAVARGSSCASRTFQPGHWSLPLLEFLQSVARARDFLLLCLRGGIFNMHTPVALGTSVFHLIKKKRSGVLRMQKLRTPLGRSQGLSKVPSF